MNNQKIIRMISAVVVLAGIAVIIGWIFDVTLLKSILPVWVTMKFSTAVSFVISGLILYSMNEYLLGKKDVAQMVLPIGALIILLLMGTLLTSNILDIRTGIEDLFVRETEGAVKTTTPGRPSVGTMTAFVLVALAALLATYGPNSKRRLLWIGRFVSLIGGLALIGYILNLSLLYYAIEGLSTAMALHTALLFLLLGIGLVMVSSNVPKPNMPEVRSEHKT